MCHRIKSINEQLDKKYKVRPIEVKKKRFYDENQKECSKCEIIKDNIHFKPNKLMKCGLDTYCRECFNEYRRERRKRK